MLELYIYLELVLKRRYGDRIHRKVEFLDIAFNRYFYGSAKVSGDSVKQLRQEMNRRLNSKKE